MRSARRCLPAACAAAGMPMVHISTDYVFDGSKEGAVPAKPIRCVRSAPMAAAKRPERRRSAARLAHHVILRTAWVYSEFGHNFLKTVLRLAATRDELRIVADQHGSPTSARRDCGGYSAYGAAAFAAIGNSSGTYHFTADGVTTWHGFASRVVAIAAPVTGRNPRVIPIETADYPTPAKRPANSRLDCRLFVKTFGFLPRHWTEALTRRPGRSSTAAQARPSHVA